MTARVFEDDARSRCACERQGRRDQLLRARDGLPHRQVPQRGRRREEPARRQRDEEVPQPRGLRILAALDAAAARTAPRQGQVAIAWQIARPSITAPIASATSVEQLDEPDRRGATCRLDAGERSPALDAASVEPSPAVGRLPDTHWRLRDRRLAAACRACRLASSASERTMSFAPTMIGFLIFLAGLIWAPPSLAFRRS